MKSIVTVYALYTFLTRYVCRHVSKEPSRVTTAYPPSLLTHPLTFNGS